jgi:ABC-2 type transport system permease protein
MKNEWGRQMTYRINQFAYRIGNIFEILIQIVIWTAIFQKSAVIKGYTYQEMMTYIIIGWLITFLMANFGFENFISEQIHEGYLSNLLVKPIDYINYIITLSIARASFTIFVALLVNILLVIIFRNSFVFSKNIFVWMILLAMIFFGYFIKLFVSILIGFLSFWTTDNSGIFYSINTFSKFLSGTYFPINILPVAFLNFSLALPFIYTFYFPSQLYLGKISVIEGLRGLGVEILWAAALYLAVKFVWKMGLKKYESVGI